LILFGIAYYLLIKRVMSKCMEGEFSPLGGWKRRGILFGAGLTGFLLAGLVL